MKILVVTEYYPRAEDPVLGVWAHRQTLATRQAGADVRVLVLYRPLPPLATLRKLDLRGVGQAVRQPRRAELDGVPIDYLRYLSPPRPWSYGSWGAWAAPVLHRALARLRKTFRFDLVHAHYAVPAGDATRRAAPRVPLVVSVHGGDLYGAHAGARTVRATLAHASLVLANSSGTAQRCAERGARTTRVVHLGADLPAEPFRRSQLPTLVTVGHLVARKRHADVLEAVALLRDRHPDIEYVIVGDGPERNRLRALAVSLGIERRVTWRGSLRHSDAVAAARAGALFVLPSVEEAFGVAYVEAMAGGVPAIGCRGEDGPEEIAAAGGGIALVGPRDPCALAARIDQLLSDPREIDAMGRAARRTVERGFTWPQCGSETVDAYRAVLGL
jgi:teichuronic acid biosynthesis glycosyltransferase TuaC